MWFSAGKASDGALSTCCDAPVHGMETISTSRGNSEWRDGQSASPSELSGHHQPMPSRVMNLESSCRKFAGHAGFFVHPASGGVQDPCRNLPTMTAIRL